MGITQISTNRRIFVKLTLKQFIMLDHNSKVVIMSGFVELIIVFPKSQNYYFTPLLLSFFLFHPENIYFKFNDSVGGVLRWLIN